MLDQIHNFLRNIVFEFTNFVNSGYRQIVLPRLLTLIGLEVFLLFFVSSNVVLKFLETLLSSFYCHQ